MAKARSYDDPCGTARALDVVGERWALLVVRELLLGPKRFGQLRTSLYGISPNVLSQRLRELEDDGVVRRAVLPPPASVTVYELTDRGRAFEPVLIELGRWGSRIAVVSDNELTADALLLAFKTVYVPSGERVIYALQIAEEWYSVVTDPVRLDVTRARPAEPDATLAGDVAALRSFGFGRATMSELESAGLLQVGGSRAAARRFPRLFRVPAPLPSG
ncbi:MAG TPA: helix-turn-helix domain-containing protein [Jatrophihabitantaceae bacterium]|jgi:DNA-binding HxlR family transcriptional regulator